MKRRPICPMISAGAASVTDRRTECLGPGCAWWVKMPQAESFDSRPDDDLGACGAIAERVGVVQWWSPKATPPKTRR